LEPDLNIALEGFYVEENAKIIGNHTLAIVKALADKYELNISKLKSIVITHDFESALQRVTYEYNHKSPSSFTNSKQSKAIGQLVSKLGSGSTCDEYTIVLSVMFFAEWFNEDFNVTIDESKLSVVINRIHHELVHVHEKNTLTCLDQSLQLDEYDDAMLISATRSWSEYLANFMSSSSAPNESIDLFLENFRTVLDEVPDEIDDLVSEYRNRLIPLDEMFFKVKQRIKLLANSYGYAFGLIDSININLQEYNPELAQAIFSSKLEYSLAKLGKSFKNLTEKYEDNKLECYEDFNEIAVAIDSIFKAFGLTIERTYEENGTGLYIHVY
jgi:hypothetical protein